MSYAAVLSSRLLFPPPLEETAAPAATPQTRKGFLPASQNVLAGVVPASRLGLQPPPPTVPLGIPSLDELTGGLPRGALTELCGPASSGRTSVLLAAMAQCTRRREVCALVDAGDSFDPASAAAAGVDLRRLLWVRCGEQWPVASGQLSGAHARSPSRSHKNCKLPIANYKSRGGFAALDQALRATDLLLQGGGFGMVAVDLGDVPPLAARRIPLASWFRFRRAVEHTPAVLLVLEQEPWAKSCASLVLRLSVENCRIAEMRNCGIENSPHVSSNSAIRQFGSSAIQFPRLLEDRADLASTAEVQSAPSHARLFQGLRLQAEVLRARGSERKPPCQAAGKFESSTTWRIA